MSTVRLKFSIDVVDKKMRHDGTVQRVKQAHGHLTATFVVQNRCEAFAAALKFHGGTNEMTFNAFTTACLDHFNLTMAFFDYENFERPSKVSKKIKNMFRDFVRAELERYRHVREG